MSRILLLGSSGFLGKSLLNKLNKSDYDLKVMIHNNDVEIQSDKFKGDILSPGILDGEISKGDLIINLTGQINEDQSNFIDLNIKGGMNLLNSCIKNKVKKIILISSINVYGENMKRPSKENDPLLPRTNYGLVKLLTEQMYKNYSEIYDLDVTILRMSNLYGPDKKYGYVTEIIKSVNDSNKVITAYNKGHQLRDLLYVEDASDGIIQTIKNPQKGFNVLNISSGKRYMIKDLIKTIEKISNTKINVEFIDYLPDERCIWADNSKSKKIIKFNPHTHIEDGLKITIDYFKK